MCLFDFPPIELSAGSACKHQKRTQITSGNHPPFNKPLLASTESIKRRGKKKTALFIESSLGMMNNVAVQWYSGVPHAIPLIGFNSLTVLSLTQVGPREESEV